MVSDISAWTMGAYGSLMGGMVTAFLLGDDEIRRKIIFISPFLVVGIIGTYRTLNPEEQLRTGKIFK